MEYNYDSFLIQRFDQNVIRQIRNDPLYNSVDLSCDFSADLSIEDPSVSTIEMRPDDVPNELDISNRLDLSDILDGLGQEHGQFDADVLEFMLQNTEQKIFMYNEQSNELKKEKQDHIETKSNHQNEIDEIKGQLEIAHLEIKRLTDNQSQSENTPFMVLQDLETSDEITDVSIDLCYKSIDIQDQKSKNIEKLVNHLKTLIQGADEAKNLEIHNTLKLIEKINSGELRKKQEDYQRFSEVHIVNIETHNIRILQEITVTTKFEINYESDYRVQHIHITGEKLKEVEFTRGSYRDRSLTDSIESNSDDM